MTNNELLNQLRQNEEFYITDDLKETYFVDQKGNKISFGYEEGFRSNDHRIIFDCFDDIEYSDFKTLIQKTKLLVYTPEINDCLFLKEVKLSVQQQQFIKDNNVELILE